MLVMLFVNVPVQDLLRCVVELPVAHREVSQEVMPCFYFQSWCAAVAVVGPVTPQQADRGRAEECCTLLFSAALQGSLCHGDGRECP